MILHTKLTPKLCTAGTSPYPAAPKQPRRETVRGLGGATINQTKETLHHVNT